MGVSDFVPQTYTNILGEMYDANSKIRVFEIRNLPSRHRTQSGKRHHDFKLGRCRHHGLRASVRNKTSTQETWRKKGVVTNDEQYEDASMRPCDMQRRF